jgi:hypothetical protein
MMRHWIISDIRKTIAQLDPERMAWTIMRICIGAIISAFYYLLAASFLLSFWHSSAHQTENELFIVCGVFVILAFVQTVTFWGIQVGGLLAGSDDI